ncbi:MAG: pilus assembly protein TadB [Planctomycetota bacterium]|nr:MAG: pilus assembly protein TadB [Planctomycetota bacterium]
MVIAHYGLLAMELGLVEQIGLYVLPLFGSIMLAYAIFNLVSDLRKVETKKVGQRLREKDGPDSESARERMVKESILRRQNEAKSAIGIAISKLSFAPTLQRMLDQANLPWSAPTVIVNLIGIAAVFYIGSYLLKFSMWVCISAAGAGFFLPLLAIMIKQKMRIGKFMNQLPDVFELMSQALRAGHSLANSILIVGQQLPDPVGTEFSRVFHEQNLGIKIEDALKDMAKRIGLMDVRFFVTAVLIQRQTGGDLAEVLDNISGVIRDRIKLFGSVKALTAEGRLSGYVLLALPVVVFLVELIINPNYADVMINEEMGQYALIGAGISQLLGLAMIQKIVNIKV